MKAIALFFILAACQLCFAAGDTNVIVISEWSKPVSLRNDKLHDQDIRGRLVIVRGVEPAYGGPAKTNGAMTFVELQDVTGRGYDAIDLCFDVTKLNCQLSDSAGKAVPLPPGGWGGRGPLAPRWVTLPYNSTLRLFVAGGTLDPLAVYASGAPWSRWSIAGNDTNTYFLSGTLELFAHTNLSLPPELREVDYKQHGMATLEFPKVRIKPAEWATAGRQAGTESGLFRTVVEPASGRYAMVDSNREVVTLKDKSDRVLWSTNIAAVLETLPGGRLKDRKIQGLKLQGGALWADLVRGWAVIDIKTGAVGIASN